MKNVKDRIVEHPGRYRMTPVSGETDVYDLEAVPGTVTEEGTALDRSLILAMQGFVAKTTEFLDDGSVKETNEDGDVLLTEFLDDGSIVETFTAGTAVITKTTTFGDNTVTEVIS